LLTKIADKRVGELQLPALPVLTHNVV